MNVSARPQVKLNVFAVRLVAPQGHIGKQSANRVKTAKDRLAKTKSLPIESVKTFYTFRDEEITSILITNPGLIYLLLEAHIHLKYIFGDQIKLALEVSPICEENCQKTILACIISPSEKGSVLNKLTQFDENWWLNRIAETKGLLNFDLEYS